LFNKKIVEQTKLTYTQDLRGKTLAVTITPTILQK
jgi:hypothetical protein